MNFHHLLHIQYILEIYYFQAIFASQLIIDPSFLLEFTIHPLILNKTPIIFRSNKIRFLNNFAIQNISSNLDLQISLCMSLLDILSKIPNSLLNYLFIFVFINLFIYLYNIDFLSNYFLQNFILSCLLKILHISYPLLLFIATKFYLRSFLIILFPLNCEKFINILYYHPFLSCFYLNLIHYWNHPVIHFDFILKFDLIFDSSSYWTPHNYPLIGHQNFTNFDIVPLFIIIYLSIIRSITLIVKI